MPDITMCPGEGCPLRETCYRYTARPTPHMQSYFVEPPYKDGKCEHYWRDVSSARVVEVSSQGSRKDHDEVDDQK